MKSIARWLVLPALLLTGCTWPEWVGKYKMADNCLTLEYIEFFPDETADIKYFSAPWAVNKPLEKQGNTFRVERFVFEYRNDSLFEVSGLEWGCVMTRDTL